jgi:hypothetical protein
MEYPGRRNGGEGEVGGCEVAASISLADNLQLGEA